MKILRKLLKIASIFIASIIFLMLIVSIVAKIFEDDLASYTMETLEKEIDAPISIGKISVNPLFSFPSLSLEVNQFWIGKPNNQNGDTLLFINNLKVAISSLDLINGVFTIKKLEISGLDFDYIVDKKGNTNIDFILNSFTDTTKVSKNKEEVSVDFSADKLKLKNINVNYTDSLNVIGAHIFIPELTLKVKGKNNIYSGKAEGGFTLSKCYYEDTEIDKMNSCTVNIDMKYDDNKATIDELNIISEGLNLNIEGNLTIGETLKVDAKLQAENLDFDTLKKYVPDVSNEIYGDSKLFKTESITANLKMNYFQKTADVKGFEFDSEGIKLEYKGSITLRDTVSFASEIEMLNMDLDILKKYIPPKYMNEYGITNMRGLAKISGNINGKYSDSTLLPLIQANVNLKNVSLQTTEHPKIENLDMVAKLTNGNKTNMSEAKLDIANIKLKSTKSSIKLNGTFSNLINPNYKFSTNFDINLEELQNYIPDSLAKNLQGNIVASIQTNGVLPDNIDDKYIDNMLNNSNLTVNLNNISAIVMDTLQLQNISAELNYTQLSAGEKKLNLDKFYLKSEQLNLDINKSSIAATLSGNISEPTKMSAILESFRLESGNNLISGKGQFKNLEIPNYEVNTTIVLNLEELIVFVPDSVIKDMNGIVKAEIQSKGKIIPDSLDKQIYAVIFDNSNFDLIFNNVSLSFPDTIMNINNMSATMSLQNDSLKIDDFNATYNRLKFQMDSSVVQNIYKTVLLNKKEKLYIKTHIKLGDIFYDDLAPLMSMGTPAETDKKSTTENNVNKEAQNWTFLIHGSISANSLIVDSTVIETYNINRLYLNDISSLFKLTDSAYIFDKFKFKAFEGEMNNSIYYKIREDSTVSVSTHNIIKNMNVKTLLRDMDSFGMDSLISYKNISGLLSTDLNTFIPIEDSLIISKMIVSGDITLEKGGVYDYPPAQELSKFTSIKELDNIQFKTLRSNIFMFKNVLFVPRTNIVSNALDIAAYGMQSLNGDSEYHLEIQMGNVLFGKSNKRNEKQEKSGEEINKKLLKKNSQKVRYEVNGGKSRVAIDSKQSREDMMNKIRVQEKMLNFIFLPKNIHYNTDI